MGFTIFIRPQVTPRFQPVHGAFDVVEQRETVIPPASYPAGCQLVYEPELDMYSADAGKRTVLLSDPTGTATLAQILAVFPLYLSAQMDVVRLKCQEHILATYPLWYQSNVTLGIYGTPVADKLRDDIAAVITESNRCEQLIYNGQAYTLNLPVIG